MIEKEFEMDEIEVSLEKRDHLILVKKGETCFAKINADLIRCEVNEDTYAVLTIAGQYDLRLEKEHYGADADGNRGEDRENVIIEDVLVSHMVLGIYSPRCGDNQGEKINISELMNETDTNDYAQSIIENDSDYHE